METQEQIIQTDNVDIGMLQPSLHDDVDDSTAHQIISSPDLNISETEHARDAIEQDQDVSSKVVFSPQHSPSTTSTSSSSMTAPSMSRDEIIKTLEHRLETIANEKKEIQIANDKLQYFLTALESENESIGEYIALYQFQRSNIQKKVIEKDALISQLLFEKKAAQSQNAELQQILYNLFGQSPPVLNTNSLHDGEASSTTSEPAPTNEALDKLNRILHQLEVIFY